jgi:glycolate oxidase FAD binding subunit
MPRHLTAEFVPATPSELARFLAENAAGARRRVCPVGGRTALDFGMAAAAPDVLIDLRELARVVDYPARDMTITVEAGLRLAELQRLLAQERQQLPIDVAQPERATLGGAIATNTHGPRRFGYGTFRDYVIGISGVDASGRLFKAGGRVVKNVAGYDLCKLLTGSRGTLAVITHVTLKLRPLPEQIGWHWFQFEFYGEVENVLERLLTSSARPVAIEVLNQPAAELVVNQARLPLPATGVVLCVGVEGGRREVDWQLDALRREVVPFGVQQLERVDGAAAVELLAALTDFPVCADDPLAFQANLRPSRCLEFAEQAAALGVAAVCHAGNGVVMGQFPEETATLAKAKALLAPLRATARAGDGNLIILHCDAEWQAELPMCGDVEPAWPLMAQLKRQLDPQGLLNPGRFVDGALAAYNGGSITP